MKRDVPWAHDNREPIREVLARVAPPTGVVLEIGAGSGQHAAWYAAAFPGLTWLPTDPDPGALASIAAWRDEVSLPNLLPPERLAADQPWPVDRADLVVAINVVHASPWEAGRAILAGAARVLPEGGRLVLYGAWRIDGVAEPSNERFDGWLKQQDPRWGLKDVSVVRAEAAGHGLHLEEVVPVPANNRVLVLRRSPLAG
ncbi:MAG: DUF938 domain-containing protein [Myxococcota bacterium]